METSARLLRLLSLLQTRRDWSGGELAQRLEVSPRTVRRDVERLRELGYPVHAVSGIAGYRLAAGTNLPPLLLDDDEAVAVVVGLRTATAGSVTGIEETSLRALAKLEQVLPSRLRHRVDALRSATLALPGGGPTADPGTLTAVAGAIRDGHRLRFDYRTHDGEPTRRDVEPHRLVHAGRRWYLVAFDTSRQDWRTFRVDRLTPRLPTGPRFTPREPPADLLDYTARGISTRPYRYQARLVMHAAADRVREALPPTVGVVEPVDDTHCVLVSGSDSLDAIAVWVASTGIDFDVEEPAELRQRVRELGALLTRAGRADR